MDEPREILQVVGSIYDAALDSAGWPAAMRGIIGLVGAQSGALIRQDYTSLQGSTITVPDEPVKAHQYFQHFASRNVILKNGAHVRQGQVVTDREILPREEFERSEFYNEFLLKNDINAILSSVLWHNGPERIALNIFRAPGVEEFDSNSAAKLRFLVPHLERACALALRLGALEEKAASGLEMLDCTPNGALILDDGRIVFANRAAERLLAAADGFYAGARGLRAETSEQTARLQAAIGRAAAGSDGEAVAIHRPGRGVPLYVLVTPFPAEVGWLRPGRRRVLMLLRDPEDRPPLPPAYLRAIFALTPAEARLAIGLYEGYDLATVAERLGITHNTARTELKTVLMKTGARRQAELIRKLAALADLNGSGAAGNRQTARAG